MFRANISKRRACKSSTKAAHRQELRRSHESLFTSFRLCHQQDETYEVRIFTVLRRVHFASGSIFGFCSTESPDRASIYGSNNYGDGRSGMEGVLPEVP